jgi:hypothetical protein
LLNPKWLQIFKKSQGFFKKNQIISYFFAGVLPTQPASQPSQPTQLANPASQSASQPASPASPASQPTSQPSQSAQPASQPASQPVTFLIS